MMSPAARIPDLFIEVPPFGAAGQWMKRRINERPADVYRLFLSQ
jgi:hypothetical protein